MGLASLLALVLSAPIGAAAPAQRAAAQVRPGEDLFRDTLATVGPHVITGVDLVQRIEWMPWTEKQGRAGMDSAKVRALQSLVGEVLLAQEAALQGLGDSGPVARMRAALRKALVRDALYRDVAASASDVSAGQVDRVVRHRASHARPEVQRALRRAVSDSLKQLAEHDRAAWFMRRALGGQRATVDSATFMLLADSLRSLMVATPEPMRSPYGHPLRPEYVDALLTRLALSLERPLVRLPDGPLSLGEMLEGLRFYTVSFRSLAPRRFAVELSAALKQVVEGEMMAREGLRRHLDDRPEVQRDLEMWTSAWRARLLLERVAAGPGASEDEALRHFALFEPERARQTCEVDVAEILSTTRERANQVRSLLEAGSSFDSLARAASARLEWAARGGRSGFFPVAQHMHLGYAALLSPIDSLWGPTRLPEGFSVFRVRGKRLAPDSVAVRPLLERMRAEATAARRAERVAECVTSLAERTRVSINYSVLREVDVLPSNMLTKRLLGFGGGMLGAPSLPRLWDWAQVWYASHPTRP